MNNFLNLYKNTNVLVTGGAGFVGSNLVKSLIDYGANVSIIDDLFTGDMKNIKDLKIFSFINDDIRNINCSREMQELLLKQNYIFHLAARNIILSVSNPIEDYLVNIGGTVQLLEFLKKSSNLQRFVYSSSASIYGNINHLPIGESDGISILSPYAASKLGGENYTKVYYEQYNLPTSIVRYSNVYGINQSNSNPYCGVIGKFIEKIAKNDNPIVFGNGEQTRDFTYVKDAVAATLLVGVHPRAIGEIFNVATGTETNINNLCYTISSMLDKKIEIEYCVKRDIDNIRRRVINIDKIKKLINWEPDFNLKQGLTETINWYLKQ